MGCLGNIIWMICGGLVSACGFFISGCFFCLTVIGIPVGIQCFKLAGLVLFPFGREVNYGGGLGSLFLNVIWLVLFGLPLALHSFVCGCMLCLTVIGIPFGIQHFKIAKLALMPFGTNVL